MEQLLADSVASRRFNLLLLGVFAPGWADAHGMGLYGALSYTVTQNHIQH